MNPRFVVNIGLRAVRLTRWTRSNLHIHRIGLIDFSRRTNLEHVQPSLTDDPDGGEPPRFVRLASHPLRWRLLRELVQSDRTVRELMVLVDEPQSLVSYHLRLLREGGLVTARRSSADRRDSYYAIDLVACREALRDAGGALHPSLRLGARRSVREFGAGDVARGCCSCARATAPGHRSPKRSSSTCRPDRSHAASAGSHPKPLHPNAVRVLRTYGLDISATRTKHLDEFRTQRFDTRDHLVRPRSRGLPGISGGARARPLERARPGARGRRPTAPRTRRSSAPPPSSRPASASGSHCSPHTPTARRPAHGQR